MVSRSRTRALGVELRELRKPSGLTIVDLGKQVGLSKTTIGRIETGEKLPEHTELLTILGALGVSGKRRDGVLEAWRDAQRPNWLATGVDGLPEQLTTLVDYELTATRITEISLVVIPGLLQTRDYARAIYAAAGTPPGEIDTLANIRLGRQEILSRDDPVDFCAVIDEAAFVRPVGQGDVMAQQLQHLITLSERSNITIQVLPLRLGTHAALDGSYVLLEFAKESPVVHSEQHRAGTFLDERADVQAYGALTKTVRQQALSPAESAGLIRQRIAGMETTT